MATNLTWGLIGASDIAAKWVLPAINKYGQAIGVFSSDPERGKKYAKDNNLAKSYDSLDELLADDSINAVYISTKNHLHKQQTLKAAAAAKHILCEKPLSLNVSDAVEMVTACKNAGVVMATNHHLRNSAAHIKIKDLLQDGACGDILSARIFHAVYLPEHLQGWRLDAMDGGGVILDITVHDADTIRFHLEEDPYQVVAMEQHGGLGKNNQEDGVMSLMKFPSGIIAMSHEAFTHHYAGTGIEFHGSQGSIHAKNIMTQQPDGEIFLTNQQGRHKIDFQPHNLYERAIALFVRATQGKGKPAADGIDGVKSLAIALAVKKSAVTGSAVEVDYGLNHS